MVGTALPNSCEIPEAPAGGVTVVALSSREIADRSTEGNGPPHRTTLVRRPVEF